MQVEEIALHNIEKKKKKRRREKIFNKRLEEKK